VVATVVWLALSGYLMYYVAGEQPRFVAATLHWTVGLAAPLLFVYHGLRARAVRRVRQPVEDGRLTDARSP
jgi:cytochrome b561